MSLPGEGHGEGWSNFLSLLPIVSGCPVDLDFLLSRGPDMALCGVRLHDVDLQPDGVGASATAIARSDDACIVLVLPPQHVAEQTLAGVLGPAAPGIVVAAQLAGASRVAYQLTAGEAIPLTAAGILAACSSVRAGGPGATDTWIELPFLLPFAPSATGLRTEHATHPVAGPDGATGLWLARFRGDGASAAGAGLELHPLDTGMSGQGYPAFVTTPSVGLRARIAQSAASKPAIASRLELTALGGNLTVAGEWDGFTWHQRTSLGRDQFVRTEERGYLYPFGFPAVQTIVTERDPGSAIGGTPIAPGQPIVLRTVTTLRLGRTVVQAPPGAVFGRTFPFDRVEVTAARFSGLGLPVPDYVFDRPTWAVAELEGQIEVLVAHQAEMAQQWGPYAGGTTTEQDVANSGNGDAASYIDLKRRIAENDGVIGEINQAETDQAYYLNQIQPLQDRLDAILREPQPPEGFGDNPEVRQLESDINGLWIEARRIVVNTALRRDLLALNSQLQQQADGLYPRFAHLLGQPRGAAEVASAGGEGADAAWAWIEDQRQIDGLKQRILAIQGAPRTVTVSEWPMTTAGQRLLFPVRLSRGASVIEVAMPMLFIKDAHLAPADDLVGYDWDQDPDLAARIDASWAGLTDDQARRQRAEREAARAAQEKADREAAAQAGIEYVPPVPVPTEPPKAPASVVAAGGTVYDLVGSARPKPSDAQVLRTLNIVARSLAPGDLFAPSLGRVADDGADRWGLQIDLPELQQLAGPAMDAVTSSGAQATTTAVVSFARQYVEQGEDAVALLEAADTIGLDLTRAADRSGGLAAIQLAADAISREHGPVQLAGLLEGADPRELIGEAATLLGFKLRDLIEHLPTPPRIVSELVDGRTPTVSMLYENVTLGDKPALGFRTSSDPGRPTTFALSVVSDPSRTVIDCQLTNFALQFPPGGHPLVRLDLQRLAFHQQTTYGVDLTPPTLGVGPSGATLGAGGIGAHIEAAAPKLTVEGFSFTLLNELQLLEELQSMVQLGDKLPGVRASARGVTAAFALPVPDVACGVFALTNLAFRSEIDVPFDGAPVALTIAFGARDKPFALSVLAFSGGGYIVIRIDADGPQIEAALEFGASLSVDFIVARGEVHALGGVTYKQIGGNVDVSGYLRLGGSLEILGLVSVSVELRLSLAYQDKKLYGRATLVLEVDLTIWSESIEIDSGLWEFQGGGSSAPAGVAAGAAPNSAGRDVVTGELMAEADALAAVDDSVSDEELAAWQAYRQTVSGARR